MTWLRRHWSKGRTGERAAARFLVRKGYRILQRNYTCPIGEIDIVAEEAETLCFVEVKRRLTDTRGTPEEAMTEKKRRKLGQVIAYYLKSHGQTERDHRLEMIAVDESTGRREIRHYPNVEAG